MSENQKNKFINDIDYVLIKAHTQNYLGKNINNNKNQKKDNIKKPRTPEINNMNIKINKEMQKEYLNKYNINNYQRPSTAPHNNIYVKK